MVLGAGLVLSGEEEEKGDLIAAHNYSKDSFTGNGANLFPEVADKTARANGHTCNLGHVRLSNRKYLNWEGCAARGQVIGEVGRVSLPIGCQDIGTAELLWCQG